MLMFYDYYVRTGLWTNWSKGHVMGKIITTDAQVGTVVVVCGGHVASKITQQELY